MAAYKGVYGPSCYNRFENLDGVEAKIISHLVHSNTKHADLFWKLLAYNDYHALSKDPVSEADRQQMVCTDINGYGNTKRVFAQPFTDDAWQEQCCSVYIYVDKLIPVDHEKSIVEVRIETLVHTKIAIVAGDGDSVFNPETNPNDETADKSDIVVTFKNRATLLLKCLLAELNGLYLDGVGYLQFNQKLDNKSYAEHSLYNNRSFAGHSFTMAFMLSGVSDDPSRGW